MSKGKSFDVLDCVHGHISHRHSCFQQRVGWGNMFLEPLDVVNRWSSCRIGLLCNVCNVASQCSQIDASYARSTQKWTLKRYELMVHTMNELMVLLWDLRCQTEDNINFLVGGPKTIASSNISALGGKWMVCDQILYPNVRRDIVRKVFSSAFYWCQK